LASPAAYSMDIGSSFPLGLRRTGRKADDRCPYRAEVNAWSYTSTPAIVLIARCLIKHGYNLFIVIVVIVLIIIKIKLSLCLTN
jgi:hypothetical protein